MAAAAAASSSSSRKSPTPEGDRPPSMEASSRESPAEEGDRSPATAASGTRPTPEGDRPPATAAASRKRPAPDGDRPGPAAAAANKRARYTFSKIEDYEMLEMLGAGGFGVVFKARRRSTGETVAVKRIRSADIDAFVREGGCQGANGGHPSIVQLLDIAEDAAGGLYMVMEYVNGLCLRDSLTSPVSESQARRYMRQLLSAATKMHSTPMATIHCDIKPENILVSFGGGNLKICDFGCATPLRRPGTAYPGNPVVGNLQYSAPEQLMGNRCYGTAVDMWALGCVMVELLVGAPLFSAETEDMLKEIKDLYEGIASIGVKALDNELDLDLSPAGLDLVTGLLKFEPEQRLTATEALQHRWFTEPVAEPSREPLFPPGYVPLFGR